VAAADLSRATGDAEAFLALDREYRSDSAVIRERLYRDSVEKAIGSAAKVQWVPPPPAGGRYQGLRITLQNTQAGQPTPVPQKNESAMPTQSGDEDIDNE